MFSNEVPYLVFDKVGPHTVDAGVRQIRGLLRIEIPGLRTEFCGGLIMDYPLSGISPAGMNTDFKFGVSDF